MTSMINDNAREIAVVGGGPAGMMACAQALRLGAKVTLFEHTNRLGKKLAITGKGRCNVTNASSLSEFMENVPRNPRFLYTALTAFTPDDTMAFFEDLGVSLKTERGKRVFPASDKAIDVVNAMRQAIKDAEIIYEDVNDVIPLQDETFSVKTNRGEYRFSSVILAGGGLSYPLTGSDGSCFNIARRLGHTVTDLVPSLVPLVSKDPVCKELQGLSLKNVGIRLAKSEKTVFEDFGEMMFTHFGVTGPTVLSASSHLHDTDFSDLSLHIDLKPALDEATLDKRLLSDFEERINKDFVNAFDALLPQKLQLPFIEKTGIPFHKKVNAVTKAERAQILHLLKDFSVDIAGFRPIEEAIVTSGGVSTKEITPKTMESKLVPHLYFAGEMIDVDAYTGGFNLQIAFSTGYLAGISAVN